MNSKELDGMSLPENLLKRLLVLGCDAECYRANLLPLPILLIEELVAASKEDQVVAILVEAATSELTDNVMLAYTLAVCVKSDHIKLKRATHAAFSSICLSSQTLLDFVHFVNYVVDRTSKEKGIKIGLWGEGLRNALTKWYAAKDAKTLASIIITAQKSNKWSHKDVLKLIHFKAPSPELNAAIKYFVFRKTEARSALNDDCESMAKTLDDLNFTEDPVKAAALLSQLKLIVMPTKFYSNPQAWVEYVRYMPLVKVLQRLEYFTASKIMAGTVIPAITQLVKDAEGSSIDPADVYIALRRYQACESYMRQERAIKKKMLTAEEASVEPVKKVERGKVKKVAPTPSPILVIATKVLLARSLAALPAGEQEWVIVLDYKNGARGCTKLQVVPLSGAAALTVHYAQQVTRKSTMFAPNHGVIELEPSVERTSDKIQKISTTPCGVRSALGVALATVTTANLIVVFSDQISKDAIESVLFRSSTILADYRKNVPGARMVLVYSSGPPEVENRNADILLLRHFDARVPRLIHGFSRGEF